MPLAYVMAWVWTGEMPFSEPTNYTVHLLVYASPDLKNLYRHLGMFYARKAVW